jgi:tetratricopeptide (TPR) repeat protein
VAPAIFLLYDYWKGWSFRRSRILSLLCFFLISGVMLAVHLFAFHRSAEMMESTYYGGMGVHLLNMPLLLAFYLKMIPYPHSLSAWQMYPVQETFNWIVGLGWAGMAAMFLLLARARRDVQFWGLWIFIFLLPVLQIIPFPVWLADRYLYIPAIGGFVLLSQLFFHLFERLRAGWRRRAAELTAISVLLMFSWLTYQHLPIWKNNLTLWANTLPSCATSAYCHTNYGLALLSYGRTEEGVKELIKAVEINPDPRFLEHLGDAYTLSIGDYRQAFIAYQMALGEGENLTGTQLFGKLARAQLLSGDLHGAKQTIERGKQVNPNDPSLWIADGFLHWKTGDWDQARVSLRRSLVLTQRRSNVAGFIYDFWPDPQEIGKLLADLRSEQTVNP